jgi:prepilin-type N-terminal cleavage/methylation domain-containing protein
MKHFLASLKRSEGFSLVEILIVMLITGTLAAGIITMVFQIYNQNERSTRNMVVVQNVENTGYWINRDALMAQNATASGLPLTLDWQDWDGNMYQVIYSLSGNTLQRVKSINSVVTNQTTVARNIDTSPSLTTVVMRMEF